MCFFCYAEALLNMIVACWCAISVPNQRFNKGLTEEEKNEVKEAKDHIQNVPSLIFQMESFLPKKNGYWMIMQMKGCFN